MRRYAVLRDMSAVSTAEPFSLRGRGPSAAATIASAPRPEPRIEVETLAPGEVRDLARDPEVAAIAPVMPTALIRPLEAEAAAPTDAWGIGAVRADRSRFTGAGVTVAVLDTGIEAGHAAFGGVSIVEEDFTGSGDGDRQGHGTHTAGTIFGRDVDGVRIGVARGVSQAFIGKVLGDDGGGDSEMIFRGLQWAIAQGADVVSMSLGFDFPGLVGRLTGQGWPPELATSVALEAYRGNLRMFDALMDMIRAREAFDGGAVIVAAAGNESRRDENPDFEIAVSLPAAAEGVISVGALGQDGEAFGVASFSNTFPQVSAPGVGVLSAQLGGGLRALNGTSMACPHVAGVAALWWEAVRSSPVPPSARAVVAKLLASARSEPFAPLVDPADRGLGLATAP